MGGGEGGRGRGFEAKDRAAVPGSTRKSWIRKGIIFALKTWEGRPSSGDRVGVPLLHRNGYLQRTGKHGQMQRGRDDVRGSDAR
jgi:hypothetical protein